MPPIPAEACLISLAPDAMDALRLARWHGFLPDLDGLEADLRDLQPAGAAPPRRLCAGSVVPDTLVATLDDRARDALRCRYGAALRIEPDVILSYQAGPMGTRGEAGAAVETAAPVSPEGTAVLHFRVMDEEGVPIAGVRLRAEGAGGRPIAPATTDTDGNALLNLETENPAAVRRLSVLPPAGFWGRRLLRPVLRQTVPGAPPRLNALVLKPLCAPFGCLPEWGIEAMGLDRAPLLTVPGAAPVRVAVLDPGAAAAPFTIATVESGALVEGWSRAGAPPSPTATVIAAAAPGARLQLLHMGLHPRASELIAAVDWCIAAGVDLLDLGFAATEPCAALEAVLRRARTRGLVVIAPAGDSGGAVLHPAAGPSALAVGAMVKPGACPADAPGAADAATAPMSTLAEFSAGGVALDLVAPGAGIVLLTPVGPVALDGTALAAGFVTGFLARLLQAEPDLAGMARGAVRAAALLAALRARCRDPGLPAGAGGAGMPVWDPLPLLRATTDPCPVGAEPARRRRPVGAGLLA